MTIEKMYAIVIREGKEIHRAEIGTARLDDGIISARKYDSLKKAAWKCFPDLKKRGDYISIVTESGKKDTFGGYPAANNVKFE